MDGGERERENEGGRWWWWWRRWWWSCGACRREGEGEGGCQEGVVPRAVCAVAGDGGVAEGASEPGRRRWWPEQRCSGTEGTEGGDRIESRGSRGRIEGENMQLVKER